MQCQCNQNDIGMRKGHKLSCRAVEIPGKHGLHRVTRQVLKLLPLHQVFTERCSTDLKSVMSKHMLRNKLMRTSLKLLAGLYHDLLWRQPFNGQVMAWCRWLRSMSPYGALGHTVLISLRTLRGSLKYNITVLGKSTMCLQMAMGLLPNTYNCRLRLRR